MYRLLPLHLRLVQVAWRDQYLLQRVEIRLLVQLAVRDGMLFHYRNGVVTLQNCVQGGILATFLVVDAFNMSVCGAVDAQVTFTSLQYFM